MQTTHVLALRGAIAISLFAAACRDAIVEPRGVTPSTGTPTSLQAIRVESYSGAEGDSVMDALEAQWTQIGRPEYRQARLDWRRRNGIRTRVGSDATADLRSGALAPNADLNGDAGRPAPRIVSHYEAVRFGHVDYYVNIPTGVEAEMTFIGDQGEIALASLVMTRNDGGPPYQTSGRIALGPGQVTNCLDLLLGPCDNTRHLSGVMTLSGAPDCDVSAHGTVSYYATNLQIPIGLNVPGMPVSVSTTGGPSGEPAASANAEVRGSSSPCMPRKGDEGDGEEPQPQPQPVDTVPVSPTPTSPAPPPPPAGPGLPPMPPPASGPQGASEDFWCQEFKLYQVIGTTRTLLASGWDCYPAT